MHKRKKITRALKMWSLLAFIDLFLIPHYSLIDPILISYRFHIDLVLIPFGLFRPLSPFGIFRPLFPLLASFPPFGKKASEKNRRKNQRDKQERKPAR